MGRGLLENQRLAIAPGLEAGEGVFGRYLLGNRVSG